MERHERVAPDGIAKVEEPCRSCHDVVVSTAADRAARADCRQREARQIIDDLDLVGRWGNLGEVFIVGSVEIDVVVKPDIDLEVRCSNPTVTDGFGVMAALAELPSTRRILYLDARDHHEAGQYWKLEHEATPDTTWRIDMWVFDTQSPPPANSPELSAAIRDALTPETRDRILAIKEEAVARGVRAYGYWLYQAVLDHDVHDLDAYSAWLGNRNVYERTGWMPS